MFSLLGGKKAMISYFISYLELQWWFDDEHEDGVKLILEEKRSNQCIALAIG